MKFGKSETQSSAESRSLNIFVDVFIVDGFFDNFSGAEGNVSWRVEVCGSLVKGSVDSSPSLDFWQLN